MGKSRSIARRASDRIRRLRITGGEPTRTALSTIAWRFVAEALLDETSPASIRRLVYEGTGDASQLAQAEKCQVCGRAAEIKIKFYCFTHRDHHFSTNGRTSSSKVQLLRGCLYRFT